jgi:aminoglycoside phosphotransferase (APT) family kinase protein
VHDVDPLRVLSALGVPPPERVTTVVGGWDTLLWRIDAADGQRFALRVFRPEQAVICRREMMVMRALAERRLPVPSVNAYGISDDRPALLMSWCAGQPVLHKLTAEPWRVWALGTAMGRMHARIHHAQVEDKLTQELPRIEIGDGQPSILHRDFHPLNVMTDRGGITGILDWANVAVGDPRVDLARTVTILRLAPTPPNGPTQLLHAMRAVLELGWRRGYRREHRSDPFRGMNPFYVWAGEWMERDLAPKLGKPGVWLEPADIARINRWTQARRQREHRAPA